MLHMPRPYSDYAGRRKPFHVPESNPTQPHADAVTFINLGQALRNAGRFGEAVPAYKKGIQRAPENIIGHIGLGATYSLMGREKEARAEAQEVLRINPMFTVDHLCKNICLEGRIRSR